MISPETKVRLGLVGSMLVGVASTFIWVGSIQADITNIKKEQDEWKQDVKEIKNKVFSIDGKMEYILNRRK